MLNRATQTLVQSWVALGPRWFPFADAAHGDLTLGRLLRLSLFQVSVGMALVLLVGTLNRVMIVELNVPATLVGVFIALPLIFAPFRALIGFKSDTHVSALGWRRVPFIWKGTMLQFGGLAVMPFALLVLAGKGHAAEAPLWIGWGAAAIAFLLVGAGMHMVQTVGLALATDLASPEAKPKVVGLMYVMLLVGMIASAFVFGWALHDFSPGRLVQVIQASALATVVLNVIAMWKQEARHSVRPDQRPPPDAQFADAWRSFIAGEGAARRLTVVALGTLGFGMADVLLEPYGGQILHLTVAETTRLTATLALGGLGGFWLASRVLSRGADPLAMAGIGMAVGIPAFALVIASGLIISPVAFALGTFGIGFGAGLFGHGMLTATMANAPADQAGLALGAWGAVQASAAGIAIALGGILRDVVALTPMRDSIGLGTPYLAVYGLEILFLIAALLMILPLVIAQRGQPRLASRLS